ncbi:MAG: TetR/AcrR family transcriptional regulator; helix-turn-helix transcriptional regulator [Firmicutes bacterium]|nr:TetR/AcrR family transcriptional regulator; helix-turn-helix transcriptional regulator [Bacillota bacterium]
MRLARSDDSPATPGRRARRRAEIRERIFRAALRLFAERGYAATTVHDITEAADVGKGTFFNYFPTKEHLLGAFSSMQVAKLEAVLHDAATQRAPTAQVLRRLVRALAEEPGRSPALVRAMLTGLLTAPAARALAVANLQRGRRRLAAWLAQAQRRGEIRRDVPPRRLAHYLQQAFFGGLALWALEPVGRLADRLEAGATTLLVGLSARPAGTPLSPVHSRRGKG